MGFPSLSVTMAGMDKEIRKLFAANFLGNLYFYLPIVALFLLGNGVSLQTLVFAQLVYSIALLFLEIPTGILADRIGHHKSVALGFSADAIGLLVVAIWPTAAGVITSCLVRSFSGAFLSGSREALLYEYGQKSGRSYKKDCSYLMSYEILGFAGGTMAAGVIVQIFGKGSYPWVIVLSSASVFVACLLASTLKPHKVEAEVGQSRLYEFRESFKLIKTSQTLRALLIVVGLTCSSKYLLMDLYQPHLEAHHVLPFFLGSALSVGALAQYGIIRHAYKIEQFFGQRLAMILLAIAAGLAYILFGALNNPYLLVASFVVLFGLVEVVNVFISDYGNQHAPSRIRATVLSSISLSRELWKVGYKVAIGLALGVIALPEVFMLYGGFLVIGAGLSYWLLGRASSPIRAE